MSTDNLDLLEREYAIRIESAADAEGKAKLEQERDRKVAAYWQNQAQTQQLEIVKQKVLAEFPEADLSALTGATEEEIRAHAKASHDRIVERLTAREQAAKEAALKESQQRQRQAAYGGGAPVGGGTQPQEGGQPAPEFQDTWQESLNKMHTGDFTRTDQQWIEREVPRKVFESFINEGVKSHTPQGE